MTKQSCSALVSKTAARIEADLESFDGISLPSLKSLTHFYQVSIPILSQALHQLEKKGLLIIQPKKKALITSRIQHTKEGHSFSLTSADRLYKHIADAISSGHYRAGTPLPKVDYFVRSFGMSNCTILDVYKRLIAAEIIYKKGKLFLVGKPSRPASDIISIKIPSAIVILTLRPGGWTGICRSTRTGRFGQNFVQEAERTGIRLIEACTSGQPLLNSALTPREQLIKTIEELDTSYLGALVNNNIFETPDLDAWLRLLLQYGRPVVWHDRIGTGLNKRIGSRLFTRCHFNEQGAIQKALEFLMQRGHRRVAYVMISERNQWQDQRLALIREVQIKTGIPMEITAHTIPFPQDWISPDGKAAVMLKQLESLGLPQIDNALSVLKRDAVLISERYTFEYSAAWERSPFAGVAAMTSARQRKENGIEPAYEQAITIIWGALGLLPYFTHSTKAIIAPSDLIATSCHFHYMKDLGLKAPDDISIISFDNTYHDSFFPLTSVDFGFDYLGYQAFHTILSDVPVARNRYGDIPARAKVIDRGSVG